jgi:hypothetical protein
MLSARVEVDIFSHKIYLPDKGKTHTQKSWKPEGYATFVTKSFQIWPLLMVGGGVKKL